MLVVQGYSTGVMELSLQDLPATAGTRTFPLHRGHQQTWWLYNYTVEQMRRFHLFLMENYVAPSGLKCPLKEGLQLWRE